MAASAGGNAGVDFTRIVRPGDTVLWAHGAGEPVELVATLLRSRHDIGPFRVVLAGAGYAGTVRPEHADVVGLLGFGAVGGNRELATAGVLDIVPCHLSALPVLARAGLHADVVIVQLSRHPATGMLSLGASVGYLDEAIRTARVVAAEVNDQAPWTHSTASVHPGDLDIVVETSRPLVTVKTPTVRQVERRIAEHIASLVEDGAVLQLGIGGVPAAVLAALTSHRRLGIHSGVIGDSLVDLVAAGAVDNSTKPRHLGQGRSVVGGLLGTERLYSFAHLNEEVRVEPIARTHDHAVLAGIPGLIAINSAIEVDLTGQVAAEAVGARYVGTVGGQVDFVRGALASPGGRSVIALPSRAVASGRSRIAATLTGPVTTARAEADVVVTEYGVACLRGRPIPQRVRSLIAIAHPDDRDQLERLAHDVAGFR
jgi:acyl-CoA hydrolase